MDLEAIVADIGTAREVAAYLNDRIKDYDKVSRISKMVKEHKIDDQQAIVVAKCMVNELTSLASQLNSLIAQVDSGDIWDLDTAEELEHDSGIGKE